MEDHTAAFLAARFIRQGHTEQWVDDDPVVAEIERALAEGRDPMIEMFGEDWEEVDVG